MNKHQAISKKYITLPLCVAAFSFISAQQVDSILMRDIEVVSITKPFTQPKITPNSHDFLNHDAGDFLTNLPELGVRRIAGSYAADPVLRGFKYEQLNVVSDGFMSSIHACPSRMDPVSSQINMSMIKQADVYKGPYQFRFGNAVGGTINFIGEDPKFSSNPKFSGRISTGYESNGNIFRNEAWGQLATKKLVFDIFGSYQKGDDYKDGEGNEVPSAFKRYNIGSKLAYQWNDRQTTILQASTNQARDVKFATGRMDILKDNTWMYSLKHEMKFQDAFVDRLNFSSFLTSVDHLMGDSARTMLSHIKSKSAGAKVEAKMVWGQNILYSGVDFRHDAERKIPNASTSSGSMNHGGMNHGGMNHGGMSMSTNPWQDAQSNVVGWFNEYQYLWGKSKITASYRLNFDHSKVNDPSHFFMQKYGDLSASKVTNSLSFSYKYSFNPYAQMTFLVGRGERAASLTEKYINFFMIGYDNYQYVGNPHLKSEKNLQADWVFSYQKGNLHLQTDIFYSRLTDFISSQIVTDIPATSQTAKGVRQMQNIKDAYKTGIEGSLQWQFLPYLRLDASAAYTYAKNISQDVPLPEIAPLDTRLGLKATLNKFLIGADMRFVASQKRINPLFGELPTKDFTVFNLEAQAEIFPKANVSFQVKNILNRSYTEYLNKTTANSNYTERFLSPGRSFALTFSYTL
ncbi:TonB-dependent receptor domain-containing protein [Elizabethkingia sp. JS20170427COW]|uniref:TonB-dependent receptor domain-containing protein n=1 Tax=Elizabethkingia sp. JS20170427COW TaxID=2583851 RepID=UPI00111093CD|nr:TonB-dependent receptor [Elizabethkingia sp. JS20170427COW]QCX53267.1 TonB-dependent receptor [Elizabethkingia sp. JS20170427COW]